MLTQRYQYFLDQFCGQLASSYIVSIILCRPHMLHTIQHVLLIIHWNLLSCLYWGICGSLLMCDINKWLLSVVIVIVFVVNDGLAKFVALMFCWYRRNKMNGYHDRTANKIISRPTSPMSQFRTRSRRKQLLPQISMKQQLAPAYNR